MEKGERKNVYKVYNKIGKWFAENRYPGLGEKNYLDDLLKRLPPNANVLDLGCGSGKPILEYLISQNVKVLGVDASEQMLEIARLNFPGTPFMLKDMRKLDLGEKFDAIIAWHSFFHLPAVDQPGMFSIFRHHLKPNGILLFTSGTDRGEVWGMNSGENLFHASLDTDEYRSLLESNHFKVLSHIISDPDCAGANVWMVQYKP
ncbi:class I SAM-dependent methyltransferase [Pedobacter sp. ISL-68]|uniref:class I SAM-dependent methyltransferase n=1 Tax=unclassified Pedobacter TaxID=2628915 RepID=UPI001BE79F5C|nr:MULTISPECIES: class I SAM-dependent methyltransferase [unclassified Pedobacter]MBT2564611.1 class I SAM-dependent methyltransferase [Pedobacter sp. ISL-64]MBT2588823.1 class I SAM-dependent methyltransferase [Pedobacter sp. ISL-68]